MLKKKPAHLQSRRLPGKKLRRKKDVIKKNTKVKKREKVKERAPLAGTCELTKAPPEDRRENNYEELISNRCTKYFEKVSRP